MRKWLIFDWFLGVSRAIALIALGVSILAYALLLLNVIQDWKYLGFCALVAFIGLFGMIAKAGSIVSTVNGKVDTLLFEKSFPVWRLDKCVKDLIKELSFLGHTDRVDLLVLGLGLKEAARLLPDLLEVAKPRHFVLKILALSDQGTKSTGVRSKQGPKIPADLQRWRSQAAASINLIAQIIDEEQEERSDGLIDVEVKRYADFPFVHGFAITHPIQLTYFSYCRWVSGRKFERYDWGRGSYRKVWRAPLGSAAADDAAVFHGFFNHLWTTSGNAVFSRGGSAVLPEQEREGSKHVTT